MSRYLSSYFFIYRTSDPVLLARDLPDGRFNHVHLNSIKQELGIVPGMFHECG